MAAVPPLESLSYLRLFLLDNHMCSSRKLVLFACMYGLIFILFFVIISFPESAFWTPQLTVILFIAACSLGFYSFHCCLLARFSNVTKRHSRSTICYLRCMLAANASYQFKVQTAKCLLPIKNKNQFNHWCYPPGFFIKAYF